MPYRLATDPGRPDRANEDFAAVGTDAAVLLDGAGTPNGFESGCVHGVAWYTRTLGSLLLAEVVPGRSLADALASAIKTASSLHGDFCDLSNPNTPSATVVAVRFIGDRVEYLVLADSVLVLDLNGSDPVAVTDDRIEDVGQESGYGSAPASGQALYGWDKALTERRNVPGGFWTAGANPQAAYEALTGSVALADLVGLAMLTDGASRLTDQFGLISWRTTLDLLWSKGPQALIDRVRDVERGDADGQRWARPKSHDDATVVTWRPTD